MRVLPYSGKRVKVVLGGTFPIPLAKVDEAVKITAAEGAFLDPVMDLDGGGLHIDNSDGHGTCVVMVPPNRPIAIQVLEAARKSKASFPTLVVRDLGTQNAAAILNDVVIQNGGQMTRGNTRGNIEYTFSYISADVVEDGALALPV